MRALGLLVVTAACAAPAVPLWEVESPSGARGLVLGTYHRGVPGSELPDVVWEELVAARRLVIEADITAIDELELLELIRLPGTLQADLTPDEWDLLVQRLGGFINPGRLDETQPWFSESVYVNSFFPEGPGMDVELQERAEAEGLEIGFLETWQYQIELLNAVPVGEAVWSLLETVRDPALTEKTLDEGIAAYQRNDLPALTAQWFDPEALEQRPTWYELILHRRNREWAPRLVPDFEIGGVFVAVGVAHLLGEPNLLTLLEDEGCVVTPFAF